MARTVLIVDDHASFRALARALLQLKGFEVVGGAANALSPWMRLGGCGRMWLFLVSSFPEGGPGEDRGGGPPRRMRPSGQRAGRL
jgi:hypothetical protein